MRRLISNARRFSSRAVSFDYPPGKLSVSQKPRIVFGQKCIEELSQVMETVGMERPLLVRHSLDEDRAKYIEFLMLRANLPCFTYTMLHDFTCIDDVNRGVAMAKRMGADSVIGCGGGNVMDTTRAIAAMLNNKGNAEDYVSATLKELERKPAPHIIVPTIAGSGSEVSNEALILNEDADSKISFTITDIVAEAVVVDPLLSMSVPRDLTVQGALTIAGQCIESLISFLFDFDCIF